MALRASNAKTERQVVACDRFVKVYRNCRRHFVTATAWHTPGRGNVYRNFKRYFAPAAARTTRCIPLVSFFPQPNILLVYCTYVQYSRGQILALPSSPYCPWGLVWRQRCPPTHLGIPARRCSTTDLPLGNEATH